MPWPVPNRPPCSTASSTPRPPSPAVAAGASLTSRPTGPGLVTSRRSSSACSRYPSRPETRTTRRTDSTTPARRTAPTEATLGPAGTPRPENPTPRQPTIHTHQRNEDPETPRYTAHAPAPAPDDVLVLSFDAKGVVMRPDGLRAATAKAAASQKLVTRLSKGEKRNRKRMAEVAAVYDLTPVARTVADILPDADDERPVPHPAPAAAGKWLCASVTDDAAAVIAAGFAEACRRDPDHQRTWVALVDGNTHQIDRIRAEAHARNVVVAVVVDFIHVLEYVWKAAWCFHPEGDPRAERRVRTQARQILAGRAGIVAAAIRRKATYHGLDPGGRRNADTAAAYLLAKKPYLDYPTALHKGWPIATGVIEGACRHLVKDRMDITGARWGLPGAEAILKLRALISNGDFERYWT